MIFKKNIYKYKFNGLNKLLEIWKNLITPSNLIFDFAGKKQARLLAALSSTATILFFLVTLVSLVVGSFHIRSGIGVIFLWITSIAVYFLSKTKHYKIASQIFVWNLFASSFYFVFAATDNINALISLNAAIFLTLVLASLFFTVRLQVVLLVTTSILVS